MKLKEILVNTLLFVISFAVVIVLAEVGFRYYTDTKMFYDIEMHKYAKKLKMRSSVPGLSHEHRPNTEARLMNVDVKINSLGFRDDELTSPKPVSEKRVLVVGQSITFGWGVPKDSIFCERLEHMLNKRSDSVRYSFVNSGIGNYNTELENILLKKNMQLVKPDMVLLHCFLRDAEVISLESQNALIANSYLIAFLYVKIKQAFFYKNQAYKNVGEYYLNLYQENSEGWARQKAALLAIRQQCADQGIPLHLVMQPDLNDLGLDAPQEKCYAIIREFLTKNNFQFTDMSPVYRQKVKDLRSIWVSTDDSHPNSAGHRIIAEEVVKVY